MVSTILLHDIDFDIDSISSGFMIERVKTRAFSYGKRSAAIQVLPRRWFNPDLLPTAPALICRLVLPRSPILA